MVRAARIEESKHDRSLSVRLGFSLIVRSNNSADCNGSINLVLAAVRSIVRNFRGKALQFAGVWPDPVRNASASEFEVDLWILSRFLL